MTGIFGREGQIRAVAAALAPPCPVLSRPSSLGSAPESKFQPRQVLWVLLASPGLNLHLVGDSPTAPHLGGANAAIQMGSAGTGSSCTPSLGQPGKAEGTPVSLPVALSTHPARMGQPQPKAVPPDEKIPFFGQHSPVCRQSCLHTARGPSLSPWVGHSSRGDSDAGVKGRAAATPAELFLSC